MAFSIRPFATSDVEAAAALLAARHRADNERERLLPPGFTDAHHTAALVRDLAERMPGVVAIADGIIVGYLFGNNTSAASGRTVTVSIAGHAVAASADGYETYREMYAVISQDWLAKGYFDHYVQLSAGDEVAREAWYSLGFGAEMITAVRDTSPVRPVEAAIEVRQARQEDVATVHALATSIARYNALSPSYRPYLGTTTADAEAWRTREAAHLDQPGYAYFVAYDGEKPVGAMLFVPPDADNALITPPKARHLWIAYLRPEARGDGVGTALLGRCLAWARAEGYEHVMLRYFTANLLGARFWPAKGFRPLIWRVARRVDERIVWARAPE